MKQTPASEPADPQPTRDDKRRAYRTLRTSWFDAVTSFLAALILFLGSLVLVLAVVWILHDSQAMVGPPPPPPHKWGKVDPKGQEREEFIEPGIDEIVQLNEPSLKDSLLAVTDAASRVASAMPASLGQQADQQGDEDGASRLPGPPEVGHDIVPRFQRWQLDFTAKDVDSYARQLDHYEIELGLIGGRIQGVDYASNLSTHPRLRHGDSGAEKRLYFMWSRPSALMQFDRQLLQRAGAQVVEREMLKFVPPELENRLAKIELEYAMASGHDSIDSIAKTVFTSQRDGEGHQFVVSEQRYRKRKG